MYTHPDIHRQLFKQHEQELIDRASRYRLAATVTGGGHRRHLHLRERVAALVRHDPAGRLAMCEGGPVAGQAR